MTPDPKPKSTTRPYMVGYVTEDRTLKMVGSYEASTPKQAVERCGELAIDELPQRPLNFVAVVASSWNTFHGAGEMKMVFAISEGHKPTAPVGDGPQGVAPEPEEAEPQPPAVAVNPETQVEPEPEPAVAEDPADTLTAEQARVIEEAEAGDFGEVG